MAERPRLRALRDRILAGLAFLVVVFAYGYFLGEELRG